MRASRISKCNLMLLGLGILSIFMILLFVDSSINSKIFGDIKDTAIYQGIVLSVAFILIALLFSYYKVSSSTYLNEKVNEITSDIRKENETLKTLSKIDPLTKLANSQYFNQRFEQEFKRAIREKNNIALIVVNIDEFDAYNDLYGRAEGDDCLKKIAQTLLKQCNRPSDLVSRVDSDEFYLLLPNTTDPQMVAKRCASSIDYLQIAHDNSVRASILSVSVGVSSSLPDENTKISELVSQAKEALMFAKNSGRSRVV